MLYSFNSLFNESHSYKYNRRQMTAKS